MGSITRMTTRFIKRSFLPRNRHKLFWGKQLGSFSWFLLRLFFFRFFLWVFSSALTDLFLMSFVYKKKLDDFMWDLFAPGMPISFHGIRIWFPRCRMGFHHPVFLQTTNPPIHKIVGQDLLKKINNMSLFLWFCSYNSPKNFNLPKRWFLSFCMGHITCIAMVPLVGPGLAEHLTAVEERRGTGRHRTSQTFQIFGMKLSGPFGVQRKEKNLLLAELVISNLGGRSFISQLMDNSLYLSWKPYFAKKTWIFTRTILILHDITILEAKKNLHWARAPIHQPKAEMNQ